MKVMQIIPSFGVAGAEIMCENLINELKNEGVDVIAVSLYKLETVITNRLNNKGIKIYYLNKKPGIDLGVVSRLRHIIKIEKPSIIHAHLDILWYVVPAAIRIRDCKVIHTLHSEKLTINKFTKHINKWFYFRFGVAPVALNQRIKTLLSNEYKIDGSRVFVVNNGINISNAYKKNEYRINDYFTFIHVGRFLPVKNHISLIKAFHILHNEFPNTRLRLIGQGQTKREIETYVVNNGLDKDVFFLGIKENVYEELVCADVFVLPSLYEGMPMTILEAMATGLPIIASNVGGISEIIESRKNGILCDPDIDSIYKSMRLMICDNALREQCGKNALIDSEKFSSNRMAKEYISIYEHYLERL